MQKRFVRDLNDTRTNSCRAIIVYLKVFVYAQVVRRGEGCTGRSPVLVPQKAQGAGEPGNWGRRLVVYLCQLRTIVVSVSAARVMGYGTVL